ncbi:MAG TPA: ParB/RepB/Spo0J family partition protein [Terriglobales bacterium]|nr:ParB/RepB/Spo0J family partition protein [Terriglobales bacterium]
MKSKLKVEWLDISKIKPYARNPRTRSEAAVQKVAASIRKFGWKQPIVVDRDLVIVAGHGRYEAALALKQKTVPIVVARDLTPAAAYRLADNRTRDETSWNKKLLRLELSDLRGRKADLTSTGFDKDELTKLLAGITADDVKSVAFTASRVPKVSRAGDTWLLGAHELTCGAEDPHQCDRLIARWQKMTGQSALLKASGQTFAETAQRRTA